MRRWRNEGDAGRGVTRFSNVRIDLAARQMTAFAGFGPLGTLDLQLCRMDEVVAGDAETGRSDLLDLIIRVRIKTGCVFTAFTGIAHAAELVHGPGHTFVGFLAEGTVTHGAGAEPFDDNILRFDFFDRDAAAGRIDEFQQIAQAVRGRCIDPVGIFSVQVIIIGAAGFLQQLDCLGSMI